MQQITLESINNGIAYRIILDEEKVGGLVIKINGNRGNLDLLFVSPDVHSKGIGYAAWCAVENLYPDIDVWETFTPYFEKRNIHFYVNRCGFHIVEFFNEKHRSSENSDYNPCDESDAMFRFEKVKKKNLF